MEVAWDVSSQPPRRVRRIPTHMSCSMATTDRWLIGVLATAAIRVASAAPDAKCHRFTEAIPRQMTDGGVCVVCQRDVHRHEGPQTPRTYEFAARHTSLITLRWVSTSG
jgi:hypothetical protein